MINGCLRVVQKVSEQKPKSVRRKNVAVVVVAVLVNPYFEKQSIKEEKIHFELCHFDTNFVVDYGHEVLSSVFLTLYVTFISVLAEIFIEIDPKSCSIHLVHPQAFFHHRPT